MAQESRQRAALTGKRRGAILTTELLLVLPIFLLLLCAILEFSLLASARTRVSDAAHAATRQLCLTNATEGQIKGYVRSVLGPKLAANASVEIIPGAKAGDLVNVRVITPMQNATPDLLWMTGFSVRERVLAADAPMIREHDVVTDAVQQ